MLTGHRPQRPLLPLVKLLGQLGPSPRPALTPLSQGRPRTALPSSPSRPSPAKTAESVYTSQPAVRSCPQGDRLQLQTQSFSKCCAPLTPREEPPRCELLRAARGAPEEVLALLAPPLGKLQAPRAQETPAVGRLEERSRGSFNKT